MIAYAIISFKHRLQLLLGTEAQAGRWARKQIGAVGQIDIRIRQMHVSCTAFKTKKCGLIFPTHSTFCLSAAKYIGIAIALSRSRCGTERRRQRRRDKIYFYR